MHGKTGSCRNLLPNAGESKRILFSSHVQIFWMLAGTKVFPNFKPSDSTAYKFVSMVLQCTGGGILVPIFINSIPGAYALANHCRNLVVLI